VAPSLRATPSHYTGLQIGDLNARLDRRQARTEDDLGPSCLPAIAEADDLEISLFTFGDYHQRRLLLGQGGDEVSFEPLHRRDEDFRAARYFRLSVGRSLVGCGSLFTRCGGLRLRDSAG